MEFPDDIIELSPVLNFLSPMPAMDSLLILACYCVKFLERHMDKPRNPAKSVMVK